MAWTPYIDTDTASRNAALSLLNDRIFDLLKLQINTSQAVELQLRLLNARIEEAFNTGIQETDI